MMSLSLHSIEICHRQDVSMKIVNIITKITAKVLQTANNLNSSMTLHRLQHRGPLGVSIKCSAMHGLFLSRSPRGNLVNKQPH